MVTFSNQTKHYAGIKKIQCRIISQVQCKVFSIAMKLKVTPVRDAKKPVARICLPHVATISGLLPSGNNQFDLIPRYDEKLKIFMPTDFVATPVYKVKLVDPVSVMHVSENHNDVYHMKPINSVQIETSLF